MNIDRLLFAIKIIESIPDAKIKLREVICDKNECGTIGCAAGYIFSHPHFRSLGYETHFVKHKDSTVKSSSWISLNGQILSWMEAAALAFDMDRDDAIDLFNVRSVDYEVNHLTDKEVWLNRADAILEKHGVQEEFQI